VEIKHVNRAFGDRHFLGNYHLENQEEDILLYIKLLYRNKCRVVRLTELDEVGGLTIGL
jgi:hypothetical protein